MIKTINGVNIIDKYYKIGSIYISFDSTNPSSIFGGTWERLKGVTLVGINESDSDANTKISFNQKAGTLIGSKYIQYHSHSVVNAWDGSGGGGDKLVIGGYPVSNRSGQYQLHTNVVGSGDSENIQPSILVYMWRRIS